MTDWLVATSVMAAGIALVVLLHRVVRTMTRPLRAKGYIANIVTRIVGTLIMLVALVYALRQLGVEVGPLLGALGIGGILMAMSLQPVLGNLVGSLLLHARRPFRPGHQIHTNGESGTVISINGRAVVLQTFDGETVHVPNLSVLDHPLRNQTSDDIRRTVMPFQVSYDTDLRHAQRVLTEALRTIELVSPVPPPDVLVTGFGESGVDLLARFWHPSEELLARWVISEVAIGIRECLAQEGITIPFPQRVLHVAPDRLPPPKPTPRRSHGSS